MENKTREEKIKIIRNATQSDEWMERMTDEDLEKTLNALASPARRTFEKVWNIAREILGR